MQFFNQISLRFTLFCLKRCYMRKVSFPTTHYLFWNRIGNQRQFDHEPDAVAIELLPVYKTFILYFRSPLNPNRPNLAAPPAAQPQAPGLPPNPPVPASGNIQPPPQGFPPNQPPPANTVSQSYPQPGVPINPLNPQLPYNLQQGQQPYQPAPGHGLPAPSSYNPAIMVQNQYGQWYQPYNLYNPLYPNHPGYIVPSNHTVSSNTSLETNSSRTNSMSNQTNNMEAKKGISRRLIFLPHIFFCIKKSIKGKKKIIKAQFTLGVKRWAFEYNWTWCYTKFRNV